MWFKKLTGFNEEASQQVRENINVEGSVMTSCINGRVMSCGVLETPSLEELRQRVSNRVIPDGKMSVRELVGDVQDLHSDPSNAAVVFQVASQFNLLEMMSPSATPECGVDIYECDYTQGPACAVAAGAGTIYRNYFASVNNQLGQTSNNQIDCLEDLGVALGNKKNSLWEMTNGYALASEKGLIDVSKQLEKLSEKELDKLRGLLRIGVQWGTEVTITECEHMVTQAYCSALPVAYSEHSSWLWEKFARLVLEASYEATICVGILNCLSKGNNKVYLTLLGGGAFGNDTQWIMQAIHRALRIYQM